MSEDLTALTTWASVLLAKLQPAQRRAVNRTVAQELRRRQVKRIVSQRAPDDTVYSPRKNRKKLCAKKGHIKRQKAAMFQKLRQSKHFKIEQDENHIAVGFFARAARIARVHHEGLEDKVSKKGPRYCYPARPLLGFSAADREWIREVLLSYLK